MLEGASNFVLGKYRLQNKLEKFDLWHFIEGKVTAPIDLTLLEEYNEKDGKTKQIILDLVKDHLILQE